MNDDVVLPPPMPRLASADGVMATRLAMRGLPSACQAPRPRGPNIHASLPPSHTGLVAGELASLRLRQARRGHRRAPDSRDAGPRPRAQDPSLPEESNRT